MSVKSILNKLLLAGTAAIGISSANAETTPAPILPDAQASTTTETSPLLQTECVDNFWSAGKTFLVVPAENKVVIGEFTPPGLSKEHFGDAAANPARDANGNRHVHTTTLTYDTEKNLVHAFEASTGPVLADDLSGLDHNVVLGRTMLESCNKEIAKSNARMVLSR